MSINFDCPFCNKHLKFSEELAGKITTCRHCGKMIIVPAAESENPAGVPCETIAQKPLNENELFTCPACGHQFEFQKNQENTCPSCGAKVKVLDDDRKENKINIELTFRIPEKEPYEGKATQKQKQKLWNLGFKDQNVIDNLGKKQASAMIDQMYDAIKWEYSKRTAKAWFIFFVIILIIAMAWWIKFQFFPDMNDK
jgi:DNA-directed RNA polymerase subunit RPC12/RpoP